jgi:DNA-binding HxlR family transcriptional regulator
MRQRRQKPRAKRKRVARPGVAVRGSTTGRPIMAALDLLGRRWTLRILWELLPSPSGFRALQQRCGDMSASVLSTRLGELRETQILTVDAEGRWALSGLGRELIEALAGLHRWSERWARQLAAAPPLATTPGRSASPPACS